MVTVRFTRHLVRFFPGLERVEFELDEIGGGRQSADEGRLNEGASASSAKIQVAEVLAELDKLYPGLADYIVDERCALRRHVNIFVNKEMVHDRLQLRDLVTDGDDLYIFQALSGGSKVHGS